MILSFSTQLNGKATHFVAKIWQGLFPITQKGVDIPVWFPIIKECRDKGLIPPGKTIEESLIGIKSKIHTIREDKTNRWKPGMMIDFFINARQKNMFRFAPRIQVVSIQEIFMTRRGSMLEITIAEEGSYIGGDDFYVDAFNQGKLSINDGFDEYDDFRNYFINVIEENGKSTGNYWFKGIIIHWTDLTY